MGKIQCDICGETFDRKFSLNRHKQNLHGSGSRHHQCKECGKQFPRQDNLWRHQRSHRAEGLVSCDICHRGFRSDYVKQHAKSCERKFRKGHPKNHKVFKLPPKENGSLLRDIAPQEIECIDLTALGSDDDIHPQREVTASSETRPPDSILQRRWLRAMERDDVNAFVRYCSEDAWTSLFPKEWNVLYPEHFLHRPETTLLMEASLRSAVNIAKLLIKHEVNLDAEDIAGNTALALATRARASSCAAALLEAGAKVDGGGRAIRSPLQFACEADDIETAVVLVKSGANVDKGEEPPLQLALRHGSVRLVKLLLDAGARTHNTSTAARERLLDSVDHGYLYEDIYYSFAREKVRLLAWYTTSTDKLSLRGSDESNARITELTTKVVDAFRAGNVTDVQRFMGSGPDGRPFFVDVQQAYLHQYDDILLDAAYLGHKGTVDLLLNIGCSTKARDDSGRTPLHCASFAGHEEVVQQLLLHGADPNIVVFGKTALQWAVQGERQSTIQLLLKHQHAQRYRDAIVIAENK
jgi:ankyrin repeat protein